MKVVRIISYEGEVKAIEKQLKCSLPDGSRAGYNNSITITVITLPSKFGLWRFLSNLWGLWK